jgi:hypothetical protein
MTDEKRGRGRPPGPPAGKRMGGMRMSELEAEGLAWLVDEARVVAESVGGSATETSVMMKLLRDELVRRKWPKAHRLKKPAP